MRAQVQSKCCEQSTQDSAHPPWNTSNGPATLPGEALPGDVKGLSQEGIDRWLGFTRQLSESTHMHTQTQALIHTLHRHTHRLQTHTHTQRLSHTSQTHTGSHTPPSLTYTHTSDTHAHTVAHTQGLPHRHTQAVMHTLQTHAHTQRLSPTSGTHTQASPSPPAHFTDIHTHFIDAHTQAHTGSHTHFTDTHPQAHLVQTHAHSPRAGAVPGVSVGSAAGRGAGEALSPPRQQQG